ncbi:lysyl-tRNA synthetase [Xylariaceae sp. FL0594]|nr:lysyl-tRNA synthetase [Xylariaceae sp. FL0594]
MNNIQCLRHLRPCLSRGAYWEPKSFLPHGVSHQKRKLHGSHEKRSPSRATSTEVSEDDIAIPASRADNVRRRVQKLRDHDMLKFPRIVHEGAHMTIPAFRQEFQDPESLPSSKEVILQGRIMSLRRSGSRLVFAHILGGYQQVQVMVSHSALSSPLDTESFVKALHTLRRGDVISVVGTATRTKTGELTLKALKLPTVLSPALAPLPEKLTYEETRILNRHVDLLVNRRTSDTLRLRSHIIKSMRDFFHEQDFLEVQTPILADSAGGAIARPFRTFATAFPEKELSLRIAPELWLKRLVIGGNDKVFEIGSSFRNEGLDTTHNPEFTTCEFYSAYSNLPELIQTTERLITRLLRDVDRLIETRLTSLERPKVPIPEGQWKQVEFVPELEKILGFRFPNLEQPDALDKLTSLLEKHHPAAVVRGVTLNKLLDHLAGKYLEGASSHEPLFIIHHPACMSPLSKSFVCPKTGQLVSARAELFIEGREVANMYEEENDPFEQRRKFELQLQHKGSSPSADDEGPAHVDESYVQALEHGLPPTGGWGCGIDRLVMFFSGASRISSTLAFGNLKNIVSLSQAAKIS